MEKKSGLCIDDLKEILHLLHKYRFDTARNYRMLGHKLGLCATTLNSIEADHRDVHRYLEEVLAAWLRQIIDPLPTFEVLRDALKGIDENYVASGIRRETCGTYDSTCDPEASIEEHAVNIFKFREEQCNCLGRLHDVARMLHKEKVLKKDDLDKIIRKNLSYERSLHLLLAEIELSISQDHRILVIFARICTNTENQDLGNDIMTDLDAAFEQSDHSDTKFDQWCCEVIGSSIRDIEKRLNSSEYLSKIKSVLKRRYCITLTFANECMAFVRRETTILNTSLLEEIAPDVKTKKSIQKCRDKIRNESICSLSLQEPTCLATLETLSIVMTCDLDKSYAETENMLSNIFGSLFEDVVRWHGIDEEGIVCYFPPVYATIVIDRILKNFSFCKKKLIKEITVGYISVYNEFLADEEYQKLVERIEALEEKNLEQKKLINELQIKIDGLAKDNKVLREKIVLLQEELEEKKERIVEFQNNESSLREKLKMKHKILRSTLLENEYLQSIIQGTNELEKKTTEQQKEIKTFEEKVSLLSFQLQENKSIQIGLEEENKILVVEKEALVEEKEALVKENRVLIDKLQYESDELEKIKTEEQREIAILKKENLLLSNQLEDNETDTQRNINSLKQENDVLVEANEVLTEQLQEKTAQNKTAFELENEIIILEERLRLEARVNIETTNNSTQTPLEDYDYPGNVFVSNSEMTLTAPSLETCQEIQIEEAVLTLSLHKAFADSASAILLRLQMTSIEYLHINRTPLSHDSVHSIVDVLQRLKALRLSNVYLPPTSLSYIFNVLLTNESLKEFAIQFNSQMMLPLSSTSAASYAQAISDVIRSNSTLKEFSALGLRLDEAGVVKILLALAKDNNTLRLLTLDQSHQNTAYRFAETNRPIQDRLSFSYMY